MGYEYYHAAVVQRKSAKGFCAFEVEVWVHPLFVFVLRYKYWLVKYIPVALLLQAHSKAFLLDCLWLAFCSSQVFKMLVLSFSVQLMYSQAFLGGEGGHSSESLTPLVLFQNTLKIFHERVLPIKQSASTSLGQRILFLWQMALLPLWIVSFAFILNWLSGFCW